MTTKNMKGNAKFILAMEEYNRGETVDGEEFLKNLIASKSK